MKIQIVGVSNFNGQHGCLKCKTVGVYSTLLHCNIFPDTECEKRTDAGFRAFTYGDHHKRIKFKRDGKTTSELEHSPLLKLPIDIVQDVIVADSLHILHLGLMKRLLNIYCNGHNGYDCSKWSTFTVQQISDVLNQIKLPMEIHRCVRGLNYLPHWKGTECAVFLNYIGIALLKHNLVEKHYQNFVNLFCAVTICSSNYFHRFLDVAENIFKEFIKTYYILFNSITSNVHNLVHVVDDVKRFGALPTISAYVFENQLYQIKKLLRSGRYPLTQVIHRIQERTENSYYIEFEENEQHPLLFKQIKGTPNFFHIRIRNGFNLKADFVNKWFLTKSKKIIAMQHATKREVCGAELLEWENAFEVPIQSNCIFVFKTKNNTLFKEATTNHQICNILCKLVAIHMYNETIFVPMHHTFPENETL